MDRTRPAGGRLPGPLFFFLRHASSVQIPFPCLKAVRPLVVCPYASLRYTDKAFPVSMFYPRLLSGSSHQFSSSALHSLTGEYTCRRCTGLGKPLEPTEHIRRQKYPSFVWVSSLFCPPWPLIPFVFCWLGRHGLRVPVRRSITTMIDQTVDFALAGIRCDDPGHAVSNRINLHGAGPVFLLRPPPTDHNYGHLGHRVGG